MGFRQLTLQEQFFPAAILHQVEDVGYPKGSINNIYEATIKQPFVKPNEVRRVGFVVKHIQQYGALYLILTIVGYAIWREYRDKTRERKSIDFE